MSYYVIYDRKTGQIVQTHASYVLGSEEPVDVDPEEVLAMVRKDAEPGRDLAVARAPKEFDPKNRGECLKVELKSRSVRVVSRTAKRGARTTKSTTKSKSKSKG